MKRYFYQVYYFEQDGDLNDTVEIEVPDNVTVEDVLREVKQADIGIELTEEMDSNLERTDAIFNQVSANLGGTWKYAHILDVLFVGG